MTRRGLLLALLLIAVAPTVTASAQSASPRTGTVLAMFASGAAGDATAHSAVGGSIGWELTHYLTIEGTGLWLPDAGGVRAAAALAGARVTLLERRPAMPFVSAAVGVQNASVDMSHANLPSFYLGRAATGATPIVRQSFDDLAVTVGGGVDLFLSEHIALRPDARALIVHATARRATTFVFGINLTYHFERHAFSPEVR